MSTQLSQVSEFQFSRLSKKPVSSSSLGEFCMDSILEVGTIRT